LIRQIVLWAILCQFALEPAEKWESVQKAAFWLLTASTVLKYKERLRTKCKVSCIDGQAGPAAISAVPVCAVGSRCRILWSHIPSSHALTHRVASTTEGRLHELDTVLPLRAAALHCLFELASNYQPCVVKLSHSSLGWAIVRLLRDLRNVFRVLFPCEIWGTFFRCFWQRTVSTKYIENR
jgi:hypothetical protein